MIEEFRQQWLEQIGSLRPEMVKIYDGAGLSHEVLSIQWKLAEETEKVVLGVVEKLKEIDPRQYFYSANQLHMTLLGALPVEAKVAEIQKEVEKVMAHNRVKFHLFGVGSNEQAVSLCAYPVGFDLEAMRRNLRRGLGMSGQDYTVYLSAYEKMGWINFMRYLKEPLPKLIDYIRGELVDFDGGEVEPVKVVVMATRSKTLERDKVRLLWEKQIE